MAGQTRGGVKKSDEGERGGEAPPPGPMALAWASTVTVLYAHERIGPEHESAVTHGAVLSGLLDAAPLARAAPRWHAELRQVRRELMGDDDHDPADGPSASAALVAALARVARGGD